MEATLDSAKEDILEAAGGARCARSRLDETEQLVAADQTLLFLLELDLRRASSDRELGAHGVERVAAEARCHLVEAAAH